MPRWGRTSTIPGAFGIKPSFFNELNDLMDSLETGSRQWDNVMDTAVHLLAKTTQGFVQHYYRGPVTRASAARAGLGAQPRTIPVRRVTSRTYQGWRVRRVGQGMWEVFSEERGAYMVEYGIGANRHRRPVLKMSGVATLRFIQRTRFADKIMKETFGSLKNNKGQFRTFASRMQGSSLLGVVGPSGSLS